MPFSVKDETAARTIMFLCGGTASIMLLSYWYGVSSQPIRTVDSTQPEQTATLAASRPTPKTQAGFLGWLTSFGRSEQVPKSGEAVASSLPAVSPLRLVVDLSDRTVYVYRNEAKMAQYPLAVGQSGWETPLGEFKVNRMKRNPVWRHPITGEVIPSGDRNPLGRHWIGFTSNAGFEIGFHGTYREDLIGQAVSHGCLRMRNKDVEALYQQTKIGTPVTVRQ
ncbi:MAG TPA: L,D-transpeptidase [Leptolyngbyaceae cyanobacterium M33_DOE_097]|uniref:L,D-transpeptidase n=1 Tax=Oscillatoriales cyanobacterium SpSt-418 TaxID=2282169 RepID=A0A7C3PMU1_9CYAN|nr:L,D-transpeptidase [Leptolyngbyaceae cyanobacterium M33_DOE_097]